MSHRAALLFRVAAVAEAFSWLGLLIGMFFKYVVHAGQGGVPILGMVHGVVFVVYLVATVIAAVMLRWRPWTIVFALLSSVPPLFTWFFEKWALRAGKLDDQRSSTGGTALFTPTAEGLAA